MLPVPTRSVFPKTPVGTVRDNRSLVQVPKRCAQAIAQAESIDFPSLKRTLALLQFVPVFSQKDKIERALESICEVNPPAILIGRLNSTSRSGSPQMMARFTKHQ